MLEGSAEVAVRVLDIGTCMQNAHGPLAAAAELLSHDVHLVPGVAAWPLVAELGKI